MMGSMRTWWTIVIALFVIIIGLLVVLVAIPARVLAPVTPAATSTQPKQPTPMTPPEPLSVRVSVSSPKENATVAHTFTVVGQVPGAWSFEAQFPVQVRDMQGNVLGRAIGTVQGDWMTEALVPFTTSITVMASYHGPALLILMKDNPSGLPEHDDSITIPIVIQ